MKKREKRSIMNAVAMLNLSDETVLYFIKHLGQNQLYKSPVAFEAFCVDCAIFYTSSVIVVGRKMNELTDEELNNWSEEFIKKTEYFNILRF